MPRKARVDAPGALLHLMVRGIERQEIFRDDADRDFFVERIGQVLLDRRTDGSAWALMPNHVHLLLRTGSTPLSPVMRRLLTAYAVRLNRRHGRHRHLFQNRYKSILCQEEPYLLELVRHIHLNPLRAKRVPDYQGLQGFAYCGHSVLLGKRSNEWQNTDYVLSRFGKSRARARRVPGSVAKSTHAGLPWLRCIRQKAGPRVHFWPFDGWEIPAGRSVIAEVYPSLWSRSFEREGRTSDQHDAYSVAAWMRQADRDGRLAGFFAPRLSPHERTVAQIEGWILGVR